eukprot:CAMPEP_0194495718 /NCGR_PEP_ID=MMETSP0253-20130528/13222_1 /TAXON_ID=2966 /ORGANISM="Noctiluca scintillans" /LENGTH=260 /DNA_ID=CAMNT_0039337015 /DNA_START=291 /DNA_END=1073 /DNA_ORIENTATION=-
MISRSRFGHAWADGALFVFRATGAVYCACVDIWAMWDSDVKTLFYYTSWTWTCLVVYFTLCTVASLQAFRRGGYKEEVQESAVMVETVRALFSVVSCNAVIVPIVVWCICAYLQPDLVKLDFYGVNEHIAVVPIVFIDLHANRIPVRYRDLGYALLFPNIFTLCSITKVALFPAIRKCLVSQCSQWWKVFTVWPYDFMDTSKLWSESYLILIFVLQWVVFQAVASIRRLLQARVWEQVPAEEAELVKVDVQDWPGAVSGL